jgi:hypothetical protein
MMLDALNTAERGASMAKLGLEVVLGKVVDNLLTASGQLHSGVVEQDPRQLEFGALAGKRVMPEQ